MARHLTGSSGPIARRSSFASPGAIALLAAIAPVLSACSLSPLNHRIDVGQEAIVVFVGEAEFKTDVGASKSVRRHVQTLRLSLA